MSQEASQSLKPIKGSFWGDNAFSRTIVDENLFTTFISYATSFDSSFSFRDLAERAPAGIQEKMMSALTHVNTHNLKIDGEYGRDKRANFVVFLSHRIF